MVTIDQDQPQIKYDEAQFNAAYRALVSLSHGLRLIEVKEVIRWMAKMPMKDINDPEERSGREPRLRLLKAFDECREVMKTTGTPRMPKAE